VLTVTDVEHVLRHQAKDGQLFGEAAVALGLLSPRQVSSLLSIQTRAARPLLGLVVELGFLSKPELERARAAFADRGREADRAKAANA
jgi:hypothetical protein